MKNRKVRVLSLLLALVMAASLFAGCSSDNGGNAGNAGGDNKGEGAAKDSLVVATMSETPSVGPYDHNAVAGSYVNSLVFACLFRTDADLNPEPWLVDTYENTSDSEWLFHLKQGVKFHDGSEMKAEDVVATLEHSKTCPEVSFYAESVMAAEVVDDYTVKITTDGPSATLLYDLCHHGNAILPKALLDADHDFGQEPIGAGPYKFVKWNRGDYIEFEAFDDYFLGAPAIKNLTWKTIPEGSSRTIALEAGEIDMIIEVEAMDAERIEGNDGLTLLKHDATNVSWLMLNNEKPGLDNENVRHAINTAINKDNVVTVALNGLGSVCLSQTPSGMLGSSDENADVYDVDKAKEYMTASGVDPASVQLSIICSNDQKKRAGEVIQADLAEIGINATIESMDLATYLSVTAEGDYTGAIGGYSASDMVSYVLGVFHSKSINASNKTRVNDPEVDALIDQAAATVDADARAKVLEELSAKLNALCTQAPLWQDIYLRAYNANLDGVAINAGGDIRFENISWKA